MTSSPTTVLIMAAGQGTRMSSALPKVLHPVCGRPMIAWPVQAAREAGADRVVVIVSPDRDLGTALPDGAETVEQPRPDGTGGAIRAAAGPISESDRVVVLSGDAPLVSAEVIGSLLSAHAGSGAAATVMTAVLDEPGSYGRVIRADSGAVERIVEAKAPGDATPEQLEIREINAGTYVFEAAALTDALAEITNDNAQGEYYLPDVLVAIRAAGLGISAHIAEDPAVLLGVNSRVDLAIVEAEARRRILERHMLAGVTVVDPGTTWIEADVRIDPDVRIEPGTYLRGDTEVGSGSVIGPHSTLESVTVGREASVVHSYLTDCELLDGCQVGPFARLLPGTRLEDGAKAGTFVEIKNSVVGAGAKVPHLSYVGDAEVGAEANLGAGTITANYDGTRKHRTVIGPGARLGVDTMLVAPVNIGSGAYTGAGAVIRDDLPPGSLGVTRADQRNIDDYAARRQAREAEEEANQ